MKQLLTELNELMGRLAYVVESPSAASLYVYARPEYAFIPQTCIEDLLSFCRDKQLHFYVCFDEDCIIVYRPELYINACNKL